MDSVIVLVAASAGALFLRAVTCSLAAALLGAALLRLPLPPASRTCPTSSRPCFTSGRARPAIPSGPHLLAASICPKKREFRALSLC